MRPKGRPEPVAAQQQRTSLDQSVGTQARRHLTGPFGLCAREAVQARAICRVWTHVLGSCILECLQFAACGRIQTAIHAAIQNQARGREPEEVEL